MTAALTTTERATLLEPCVCGHSINNHGSLVACWTCDEDNRECVTDFEELLCTRVAVIVEGRGVGYYARLRAMTDDPDINLAIKRAEADA